MIIITDNTKTLINAEKTIEVLGEKVVELGGRVEDLISENQKLMGCASSPTDRERIRLLERTLTEVLDCNNLTHYSRGRAETVLRGER